jgi:catechol 2,3-dioxygenase-like lactoylglutathione lyase family enzyme
VTVRGIHHVQIAIPAGGEERGRAFYGGLLGLAEIAKPAALIARGGCWFRSASIEIHLGVDPEFRASRKAHVAIRVDDLELVRRRLSEAGVQVSEDDFDVGFDRFYADDPFGNRFEFVGDDYR